MFLYFQSTSNCQTVNHPLQFCFLARETLGLALGYFDEFEKEAQALYAQSITDAEFSKLIQTIYPKPDKDSAKVALTKWENKVVLLDDLYHNSPTNATIKGTKWGAFNALTERLDYFPALRCWYVAVYGLSCDGPLGKFVLQHVERVPERHKDNYLVGGLVNHIQQCAEPVAHIELNHVSIVRIGRALGDLQ